MAKPRSRHDQLKRFLRGEFISPVKQRMPNTIHKTTKDLAKTFLLVSASFGSLIADDEDRSFIAKHLIHQVDCVFASAGETLEMVKKS